MLSGGYHPVHRQDLLKSGISEEVAQAAGIYTVPPDNHTAILGNNAKHIDSMLGFRYGSTGFTRYKLFPPIRMNGNPRPVKYYQPNGSPVRLYTPPGFDPDKDIMITEGEKKAIAGTLSGLNVCGVGGIWNFAYKDDSGHPHLIDDLAAIPWTGKKVQLIPDGDFQTNPGVCHAVYRLGSMLEKAGAEVRVVQLPENDKLDDYLLAHGPESFSRLDRIPLNHRIFRPAIVQDEGYIAAIRGCARGLGDFLKLEVPPRPYILSPLLRPGTLGEIYSIRGWGKTTVAAAISVSIAYGLNLGRWVPKTPVGILYLDGEMEVDIYQERLRKMTKNLTTEPKAPITILSSEHMDFEGWPRPNLADPEWRKNISLFLKDGRHKLLIIDNVAAYTVGLDENVAKDWDDINQWFLSLRFMGCACIFLHHSGKSGDSRGTSHRQDALDFVIQLTRPSNYQETDGCNVNINFTKARNIYGPDAAGFNFRIVEDGEDAIKFETKEFGPTKSAQIIALLAAGAAPKLIVECMTVTEAYVSKVKKEAFENGYLEPSPKSKKRCRFTEEGKKKYGDVDLYTINKPGINLTTPKGGVVN
jgi:hypothetical protein